MTYKEDYEKCKTLEELEEKAREDIIEYFTNKVEEDKK